MNRVAIPLDLAPRPAKAGKPATLTGPTMGVQWTVKATLPPELPPSVAQEVVQERLNRVVAQMSPWESASDIGRFNRAGAGRWMALPPAFFTVLEGALDLAESSGGAFDPTVGELVDLWGFGPAGAVEAPPSPQAIAEALERTGWRKVLLDREGRRALQPGGVRLDLSGIAKGFGVDEAARALESLGVRDYLVEIGGELRGAGLKPDGQPWWVEVEAPEGLDAAPLVVALHGLSIATTGDYRRFLIHDGERFGHTLDPRTGWPARTGAASVTVLHAQCMWADALCTLLAVLEPQAAMEHARQAGVAARLVLRTPQGLEERVSPALQAMLG